jgi:branched-chain amino acid aminotransferase
MTQADAPAFTYVAHERPVAASEREAMLADPGFGRVFTDHMVTIRWSEEKGWHDGQVGPRRALEMNLAASVLHYAQEIFEGLKAYKLADGGLALFRPEANAARFVASAERLAMAPLPPELFVAACEALVKIDRDWVPAGQDGALYLRPFMFASEVFLGVKPASEYLFAVIASSVGPYFKGGMRAVSLFVSETHTRAAPGGTGAAKCGGNYAASLVAQAEAIRRGCDQVLFLDAVERRWIEELGGMNVFFVFDDGSLVTPPLTGTILPGITRDSLITLSRDMGLTVREEPYAIDILAADVASGRLIEAFACGTAAVVTPIGRMLREDGQELTIGSGGPGQTTMRLREALVGMQRGATADAHGWLHRLD